MVDQKSSVLSQFRLDKRVAMITGSGDGLGRAAAIAFGLGGSVPIRWTVVTNAIRNLIDCPSDSQFRAGDSS